MGLGFGFGFAFAFGLGLGLGLVRETKDMWHLVRAFGRRVSGLGLRAHIRANVRG